MVGNTIDHVRSDFSQKQKTARIPLNLFPNHSNEERTNVRMIFYFYTAYDPCETIQLKIIG